MRILVIDDDEAIRKGIRHLILQKTGPDDETYEAENGLDAFEMMHENRFDLVFVDVRMPVMNGIRLLELAVPLFPGTSFIVVSAFSEFDYVQKALRLGAVDYLLKPVDMEELEHIIDKSISSPPSGASFPHDSTEYRIDWLESLYILITQGFETRLLERYLPSNWKYVQWILVSVDANVNDKNQLTFIKQTGRELMRKYKKQGVWFDGFPAIVLIQFSVLNEWLEEYCRLLEHEKVQYSLGISSVCRNLFDIHSYFHQSETALQRRLLEPARRVFHFRPAKTDASSLPTVSIAEKLKNEVIKGKLPCQEDILTYLSELAKYAESSPELYFSFIDRFCYTLFSMYTGAYKESPQISEIEEFLDRVRMSRSLLEVADQLSGMFQELTHGIPGTSVDYYDRLMKQAKQYIEEHIYKKITLDEVANQLNISVGHFSRQFRKMMGINFIAYVTELKLEEGRKLLMTGQYKIFEVADKLGYSSWKHFSRLFHHKYGQTPSEFIGKR